jgi:hypothetical protein
VAGVAGSVPVAGSCTELWAALSVSVAGGSGFVAGLVGLGWVAAEAIAGSPTVMVEAKTIERLDLRTVCIGKPMTAL